MSSVESGEEKRGGERKNKAGGSIVLFQAKAKKKGRKRKAPGKSSEVRETSS